MQGESMPGWDLTSQALRGPVPHEAIVCQVRRSSSGKRKLPLVREAGVWGSTSEAASSLSSRRQTSRTDGRVMRPPEASPSDGAANRRALAWRHSPT